MKNASASLSTSEKLKMGRGEFMSCELLAFSLLPAERSLGFST